ncbi:hypothetical protein TorRG33x02_282380 [Trema orientale]|uniref:Uncharacterized protein n=1 Tax=Trema orientale TaxID=63057 RepID=A0A2P5CJJ3_TREOI|nr:hypothetical protein TorRG33x02_282380 [Trema orientale]
MFAQPTRDDSRRRPVAIKHGLLADEDRECYRVRREARRLVSIDTAMEVSQPKPRQQLDARVVSSSWQFENPRVENIKGFEIGVPNRSQGQLDQRSIVGDMYSIVDNSRTASSTHATKDHVAIDKEIHSRFPDDCFNEVIEDSTLECSHLFLNDHLEGFDIEDKPNDSELLSQEVNDILIENGEVKLDNEKLEEMKDSRHMYVSLGKEMCADVVISEKVKTFI